MEEGGGINKKIDENSLLGRYIRALRDKFIASFASVEMRLEAGGLYDEYVAAGCSFSLEDLDKMRKIVETVCAGKTKGELLVKKTIDEVRMKLNPLPKRGEASSGTDGENVVSEEERLLEKNKQALKAARLPSGMGFEEERPAQSGIKLLRSFRSAWHRKKQA